MTWAGRPVNRNSARLWKIESGGNLNRAWNLKLHLTARVQSSRGMMPNGGDQRKPRWRLERRARDALDGVDSRGAKAAAQRAETPRPTRDRQVPCGDHLRWLWGVRVSELELSRRIRNHSILVPLSRILDFVANVSVCTMRKKKCGREYLSRTLPALSDLTV